MKENFVQRYKCYHLFRYFSTVHNIIFPLILVSVCIKKKNHCISKKRTYYKSILTARIFFCENKLKHLKMCIWLFFFRSGEVTTHFQNESKQRKEEEAGEAVDVCASSHGTMGLYELSDGFGSNSEGNCRGVPRSSIRSAHFSKAPKQYSTSQIF